MPKQILIISAVHDYRMKRRGSIQAIAEALRDEGSVVTFLSIRFSWLSYLRHDPREEQLIKPNILTIENGIRCFLWRTAFHPFATGHDLLNHICTPLFWLYARWPSQPIDALIRDADTVIIESGLGVVMAPRVYRLNPSAVMIYRASDRLSTIGQHPVVARTLQHEQSLFSHFGLLGRGMAVDFEWAFPRAFLVPPAVDPRLLQNDSGTPYNSGRHAVSLGPMLFDPSFFEIAGPLFPDLTFHIFGAPFPRDGQPANVIYHPEIPYADTIPFIAHANIGIAPYRTDEDVLYLQDTSSKLLQYAALGVPAVCPNVVVGPHPNRYGYEPGDRVSIRQAIEMALAAPRLPAQGGPKWQNSAARLVRPEEFEDTLLVPCPAGGISYWLTLVVATRGRREPLCRLLESLCQQSRPDFDVLIVDQNAEDFLDEIIADFSERLHVSRIYSEPGLSHARNRGLEVVRGAVIAFPDDDCWYPPTLVADILRFFAVYKGVDALMGRTVDADGQPSLNPARLSGGEVTSRNVWFSGNSNTLFVRRSVADTTRFSERLGVGAATPYQSGEETDFVLEMLARGSRVVHCPNLIVHHDQVDAAIGRRQLSRAWHYSAGFGRVLRERYSPVYAGYRIVRSFVGAAVSIVCGRPLHALYRATWGIGTLRGWLF